MDEELQRKRDIAALVLLGMIIAGSVGYYFWGSFINRGELLVRGNTPFTVEFFGGKIEQIFECSVSPCSIEDKRGRKQILASKEGYESIFENIKIPLWGTEELYLDFKLKPALSKVDSLPIVNPEKEYEIVFDQERRMQKLIRKDDPAQLALIYFQKGLVDPKVFGSEKAALIVDGKEAYRINLKNPKKEPLNISQAISEGIWSPSGKNFAFKTNDASNIWILDEENKITKLQLKTSIKNIAWTFDDRLFFIGRQFVSSGGISQTFSKDISYLSFYMPSNNSYYPVELEEGVDLRPQNIVALASGNAIFIETNEEIYKLILE
ncbi:hypothetical protein KJ632_04360 [Patescibacteria group bacterium]|nr:hypothetical protein [Patescibacteria group bacterium]